MMRLYRACAGDRYLLKLFRDFVFHQVGDDGAPLLDWGHIAEALAKLDAGLPEKARCDRGGQGSPCRRNLPVCRTTCNLAYCNAVMHTLLLWGFVFMKVLGVCDGPCMMSCRVYSQTSSPAAGHYTRARPPGNADEPRRGQHAGGELCRPQALRGGRLQRAQGARRPRARAAAVARPLGLGRVSVRVSRAGRLW